MVAVMCAALGAMYFAFIVWLISCALLEEIEQEDAD
jgi:hypothetical protein